MENRNYTIDILRFVAALWVTLFHLNQPFQYIDNWYRNIIKFGHLGVPVFFVISGYCILLSATRSFNASEFLTKRLFRIMPAFWVSIFLVLSVVIFQKLTTGYNSVTPLPKDFMSILATITLLTYPFSTVQTINWVYWSLTYELFFYLIIAISLFFPKAFRLPIYLLVSIFALIIPVKIQGYLFFLNHWPTFALGLGAYLIYHREDFKKTLITLFFITISLATLIKNFMWAGQIGYSAAVVVGLLIIMLSHHFKMKNNPFSKLGDYSYAVYLIHVPIGCYLVGSLKNEIIQKNMYLNIAFDLFTYAMISFIAFLIFRNIERPFISTGKHLAKNYLSNSNPDKQNILLKA